MLQLTAPKASDSIVCILTGSSFPSIFVRTPFFATKSPPATVQNLMCFTPTVTS